MKEIRTKRLRIAPLTKEQMGGLIKRYQADENMAAALKEMYNGCIAHPKDYLWYTNWQIFLCPEGTYIGSFCFKGAPQNGAVEIGYGVDEPFQNQGYTTEAVKAALEWAFSQHDVYFVFAETAEDNAASIRVLEKNGFISTGEGEEGPRWSKEKNKSSYMSFYLCLGMCFGSAIGVSLGSTALGISIGMCLGIAIGTSLDAEDKKKRTTYKGAMK